MGNVLKFMVALLLMVGLLLGLGSWATGISNNYNVTYQDNETSVIGNNTFAQLNGTIQQLHSNLNKTTPDTSGGDITLGLVTGGFNSILTLIPVIGIGTAMVGDMILLLENFGVPVWATGIFFLIVSVFILIQLINAITKTNL